MKKQQGLTLIELMISLVLGLFLIAAVLSVFINTVRSSTDTIKAARLNHDLDMAMNLMISDIRRAGYSGGATFTYNAFANPFSTATTTVQINNSIGTDNDCILYSYDADDGDSADGVIDPNGALDVDEYFGFRRKVVANAKGNNVGVIQMRLGNADCVAAGAQWQAITDENTLDVTAIKFSFATMDMATLAACANIADTTCLSATSRCIDRNNGAISSTVDNTGTCTNFSTAASSNDKIGQRRVVNIHLAGRLVDDAVVAKSLNSSVEVVNERLYRQP
jgi:type IV pilus assembly protein PilW